MRNESDWTFSFSHLASVSPDNEGIFILQILGILMGVLGLVFFLGAAVGMVRFPDFFYPYACGREGGILCPQC